MAPVLNVWAARVALVFAGLAALPVAVSAQAWMSPASAEPATGLADADAPAAPDTQRWVLGATVHAAPRYTGGTGRSVGLRPVLAGRVGRWFVSSSSARGLAGVEWAGGVSTTLAHTERWSVGLGARLTHGRSSADDPMLAGLPDIPSSLGIRASVRYSLSPHWRLTGTLQQDVLRAQGLRGAVGWGWSKPVAGGWVLDVNGGLNVANARAMRTFFGVPASAARVDRPAWQASGGVESWFWGVGVSRAVSAHWRVAGSIGRGTLLGDAAHSPLTQRRSSHVAQISLAYVGR